MQDAAANDGALRVVLEELLDQMAALDYGAARKSLSMEEPAMSCSFRCEAVLVGAALLTVPLCGASAQTGPAADEQKIRSLIAAGDVGKLFTADIYFTSGAFPHPIVGTDALRSAGRQLESERRNQVQQETPDRVVVAPAGDMAYEYGHEHISFEKVNGGRDSFNVSYLRVWRKDAGQWRIAAFSARPDELRPAP